jgi:AcrR family transcriptional regulator
MMVSKRVRAPQQARSEETQRRIGEALVSLLEDHTYAGITIGEICSRANASPSSFYARFADKAAVLEWLQKEYFAESQRLLGERLDPDRWRAGSLETLVRNLMRGYIAFLRRHRAVLRAIAVENRMHPGGDVGDRSRALNLLSYERITQLVLARREEITHPDPAFAAAFGLTVVYATSQEVILFGDVGMHPVRPNDETLAQALAATYLGVLCPSRVEDWS